MCGYGWGSWLGMGVTMVLFWGLVIGGIIALVRYLGGVKEADRSGPAVRRPQAEEVLAERFVRGEIDADEYRQRLELLRWGR